MPAKPTAAWLCAENGEQDWVNQEDGQGYLYSDDQPNFTKGESEKCRVIYELEAKLKKHWMPVSLRSTRDLRTRQPSFSLNFWNYEPQHEADKAPTTPRTR